ncbi:MAG: RNA pseudouridine synthase [Dethiosulfovibrio peptidovorans]|nr:MAG: RNA pseudouridine synthase [Dethiosulfovibrio peptidovorans]
MDRFIVGPHDDGRRLDKVIRARWPELPLGAMMKGFRKKQIRVDGGRGRYDQRIREGQEVVVPWEAPQERLSRGVRRDLETLYRDSSVWVVNKPAGLLSQPDRKGGDSVVSRAWVQGGDFSPQAVHRLDRNTSGVMVLALSGRALRELSDLWARRTVEKIYWVLVQGSPPREGRIDAPLRKDERTNVVSVHPDGQPAVTLYRCLAVGGGVALCQISLLTGRPHQIRVHMAHLGFPVLGDRKYGGAPVNRTRKIHRPMLHARSIRFPYGLVGNLSEVSGIRVLAPIPDDMEALLPLHP